MTSLERLNALHDHLHGNPCTAAPAPTTRLPYSAFSASKELEAAIPGPWDIADARYGHHHLLEEWFSRGHAHLLMQKWRQEFGPIYGYYSYEPSHDTLLLRVVLSDFAEARRILKENPPKARGYEASIILGEGVLSNANPKEWARQRALLKPAFSSDALKDILPIMIKGSAHLLQELEDYHQKQEVINIHEVLSAFAFLMIGHSALGEEDEFLTRRAKQLREAFGVAAILELSRADVATIDRYQKAKVEIGDFSKETFQRFSNKEQQGCPFKNDKALISIITAKDPNGKPVFNEKQKANQLSTFMFAGHETTANSLCWAIIELARHPECMKKLQKEIDLHLQPIGGEVKNLSYSDLFKFSYLTLVINETLRLWPAVATGTFRQLAEDTEILGRMIPRGTVVNFSHYNIHRDKSAWGETAEQFNPDREWHNDAFLPFTIFPRDCLGRNLAMLEMRIVLISIFAHYNVILKGPQEFKGFTELTLRPECAVWVSLERREH